MTDKMPETLTQFIARVRSYLGTPMCPETLENDLMHAIDLLSAGSEVEMPPPHRHGGTYESAPFTYYTADQMRAYAAECVAQALASREQEGEQVTEKMVNAACSSYDAFNYGAEEAASSTAMRAAGPWVAAGKVTQQEATPPAPEAQDLPPKQSPFPPEVPTMLWSIGEAKALLDCFGGSNTSMTVREFAVAGGKRDDGSVMEAGKYAWCTEYPEEGSMWLGPHDPDTETDEAARSRRDDAEFVRVPREPTEAMIMMLRHHLELGHDVIECLLGRDYAIALAKEIEALVSKTPQTREEPEGG